MLYPLRQNKKKKNITRPVFDKNSHTMTVAPVA